MLYSSHKRLDQKSLKLHELCVNKILDNPSLFERLKENNNSPQRLCIPNFQYYINTWNEIIDKGMDFCFEQTLQDNERGDELRQTSPYVGILTPQERKDFLLNYKK